MIITEKASFTLLSSECDNKVLKGKYNICTLFVLEVHAMLGQLSCKGYTLKLTAK